MVLAAIMLKLGAYGFLRFSLPITPDAIRAMFAEIAAEQPELKLPSEAEIGSAYSGLKMKAAGLAVARDVGFRMPTIWLAEAHSAVAPVYLYRFDWATPMLRALRVGATHATELLAVFGMYDTRIGSTLTLAGDRRAARRVTAQVQGDWLSFARSGAPEPGWEPYTADNRAVRVIDDPVRTEHDPSHDRRLAWQGFHGYSEVPLGVPGQS